MVSMTVSPGDQPLRALIGLAVTVMLLGGCTPTLAPDRGPRRPAAQAEARVVAGVRLIPVSRAVSANCAEEARRFPFPAPCPQLLPAGPSDLIWCNGCEPGETFNVEGYFRGPAGYRGAQGGGVHLVIEARPADGWMRRSLCRGAETAVWTAIRGEPARWMLCPKIRPPGRHSDHVALVWKADRATYVVSLHGQTQENRRLAAALARQLVMLP